jgi:hypothetical protein
MAVQVCVSQAARIDGSDSKALDRFGVAVAMINDRIVIGAEEHTPPGMTAETGAAYVIELIGGTWQQQAKLIPSLQADGALFGHAVACDDSRVWVGAPYFKPLPVAGARGLVFVYVRAGNGWLEEAVLDPQDPQVAVEFGGAIDIDGDTLLVGARGSGPGGAAYVFVRIGSSWTLQAKLTASDAAPYGFFGCSVELQGDQALVGANGASGIQTDTGAVYSFSRTGTTWTETQKIIASNGRKGDRFGESLALDGSTLAIGAPMTAQGIWGGSGSTYIFDWNGQQWQEAQQVQPDDFTAGGSAGTAVTIEGGRLALGAPNDWLTPGFIHLATNSPQGWNYHLKFSCNDGWCGLGVPCFSSNLGRTLALDGSRLVAGAPFADTAPGAMQPRGAVYVFDLQLNTPQPTQYCTAKQDSKGCTPQWFHAGMPSVSAAQSGIKYKIECYNAQLNVPSTLFYSTSGASNTAFAGGLLCIQPPFRSAWAATTIASGLQSPCDGWYGVDFNAWIASGNDPSLTAGQNVWMQYWYRDPAGLPGANIGLSDGIYVSICP